MTRRETVDVGGVPISYLTSCEGGALVAAALVWGEDDPFQTVDYAERYAREIPETKLVRIKSAGHIPMENEPRAVAKTLAEFFAAKR